MLSRDGPVHDVRDTHSTRGSAMATRSLRAHCGIPACARPFGPMIADSSPVRVEFACDESGAPTRVELLQPGPLQELSPIPHALPTRPLQWVAEALSGYDWVGPELQQGILRSLIGQACLTPSVEGWAHAIHFAVDQVSGCMPTTCPADICDSLLSGMAFWVYILYWKHKQDTFNDVIEWGAGRRCAVCRARLGAHTFRYCNICWNMVCNSEPCLIWSVWAQCWDHINGDSRIASVERQERMNEQTRLEPVTGPSGNEVG